MIIYLSGIEAAERLGIGVGTFNSYLHKGLLPEPDALLGSTTARPARGWLPETIDAWNMARPGRGRVSKVRAEQNS